MSTMRTPNDHTIPLRDYRFGRDQIDHPRWWVGGDPYATAFFNALSATFPLGERFFMDSVRAFRKEAKGPLCDQIAAFLYQESMHSREHVVFNAAATRAGYDMGPLEARTERRLKFARSRIPIEQLAGTVALEHFTAILAHAILKDPAYLKGAPADAAGLWRWHAVEEIEHKAVAFDTFLAATEGWSGARRWLLRVRAMIYATLLFYLSVGANLRDLLRQDGMNSPGHWLKLLGHLFVTPGIGRRVLLPYLAYYRPGFHPWEHDDRDLLEASRADIAPPNAAGALS